MGKFGTDSFLARPRRKMFPADYAAKGMVMVVVIYSGNGRFSLWCMHVGELPEFLSIMSLARSKWPRCLLWHGWLPGLGGAGGRDPWAASSGQLACCDLERCLGAYLVDGSAFWTLPDYWDVDDLASKMPGAPNIWTSGSREDFSLIGGLELSGAGVYACPGLAFDGAVCGVAEEYGDARLERCRVFMPVPGPLQSVQRAEFWSVIVALQSYWPCHLDIHNLNVAWSIRRLLGRVFLAKPLPLVTDGDLVAIAHYMICTRARSGSPRLKSCC